MAPSRVFRGFVSSNLNVSTDINVDKSILIKHILKDGLEADVVEVTDTSGIFILLNIWFTAIFYFQDQILYIEYIYLTFHFIFKLLAHITQFKLTMRISFNIPKFLNIKCPLGGYRCN